MRRPCVPRGCSVRAIFNGVNGLPTVDPATTTIGLVGCALRKRLQSCVLSLCARSATTRMPSTATRSAREIASEQLGTFIDLFTHVVEELSKNAIPWRMDGVFHFHGVEHCQWLAFFNSVTGLDGKRHHLARHRSGQATNLGLAFTGMREQINCRDLGRPLRRVDVGHLAFSIDIDKAALRAKLQVNAVWGDGKNQFTCRLAYSELE